MEFLFLTSFYLFGVLFCSTSYCTPIESVRDTDAGLFWLSRDRLDLPSSRGPRPTFLNLAELCTVINPALSHKWLCLVCKGLDVTCLLGPLIPTTTTTPASTTTVSTSTLPPITFSVPASANTAMIQTEAEAT